MVSFSVLSFLIDLHFTLSLYSKKLFKKWLKQQKLSAAGQEMCSLCPKKLQRSSVLALWVLGRQSSSQVLRLFHCRQIEARIPERRPEPCRSVCPSLEMTRWIWRLKMFKECERNQAKRWEVPEGGHGWSTWRGRISWWFKVKLLWMLLLSL